jgi:hypothetical protein
LHRERTGEILGAAPKQGEVADAQLVALIASGEFVAKDSRAPAKLEPRVVADAIVSSEAMRNANAIVATGALSS